jgi:hypothetical protein
MCLNEIHICICLWEKRNENYILSFSLELIKVGGYYFPHPCDGPRSSHLFCKQPLVDTEFDMPGASKEHLMGLFMSVMSFT